MLLTQLLSIARHPHMSPFICCWLPCGPVLLSILIVPPIWLVMWCCHIVVVVEVVEWLQEVVGIGGGGGDEAEVVDDGGREGKCAQYKDTMVTT